MLTIGRDTADFTTFHYVYHTSIFQFDPFFIYNWGMVRIIHGWTIVIKTRDQRLASLRLMVRARNMKTI